MSQTLLHQLRYDPGKGLCQLTVTGGAQVHEVHLVELAAQSLGIQEVAADQIALLLIIMGQLPGSFRDRRRKNPKLIGGN